LLYVRGGDHDANWDAAGNLAPDPNSSPQQQIVAIWRVRISDGLIAKLAEGDAPAVSATGQLAFVRNDQVWTTSADGRKTPARLFFDRGKDGSLEWSPAGDRLAFVSDRGDHAFIGVFRAADRSLLYLAPSTGADSSPRWSPDGRQIAYVRRRNEGGPPRPLLKEMPDPWLLWVANSATGAGRMVWRSPDTLLGSYPEREGGANLGWAAGNRLVFLAELDGWPHLYSLTTGGGPPLLLTPGAFMVEQVAQSRDLRLIVYSANAGFVTGDSERRHLYRVPVDRAAPVAVTEGETLEYAPVAAGADHIAFIAASTRMPPSPGMIGMNGQGRISLGDSGIPKSFPADELVIPKAVVFKAADGTVLHAQLFQSLNSNMARARPGIIYVHGGPSRQMLLGWHNMEYYSRAYAVNQYLASRGFVVLAVNYRWSIGYGRKFDHPDHAGPAGAAEYADVLAGARFLQRTPGVDPGRIGVWGGSYGGYLTALALARNSNIFKAGVDLNGLHDLSRFLGDDARSAARYERGDYARALKIAWQSSPDASMDGWRSPVLLIHGDDDRNVPFRETVDVAARLQAHHVPYEQLIIPNETHGFLRHASWISVATATVSFFAKQLGETQAAGFVPMPGR
jgi:dipeptidyl aminopeptidase/acylaminoacyl peptidase